MMFKRLGILGVLAVCLFAIVIVMVGCGNGDEKIDPPIVPPVEETKVETPMEKLTGTYSYVAGTYSYVERVGVVGVDVQDSPVSGLMHLRAGGNGWLWAYEYEDGEPGGYSGPTWSANATTLTFIPSDGERIVEDYTLEGKVLTVASFAESDDELSYIEKWRKD